MVCVCVGGREGIRLFKKRRKKRGGGGEGRGQKLTFKFSTHLAGCHSFSKLCTCMLMLLIAMLIFILLEAFFNFFK